MKKYNVLVPMAGRGQRFVDAGYKVPKQFIHVGAEQLLDISLNCFDLEECNLIFVVRDDQICNYNVDQILSSARVSTPQKSLVPIATDFC